MLIVIEGLDGAGKSTQVKKMRRYLESILPRLDYIHFPRYDAPLWGSLIGRFLRGDFGDIDAVHPNLVALLFAGDRHDASAEIRRALDDGATVLLDRYVYSNIAYQCAKMKDEVQKKELRKWIFDTEYNHFSIPRPDLNIFLDVPISFVEKKLTDSRAGSDRDYLSGGRDIHEADIEFQKKVRDNYLAQCQDDESFIRVDCADENGNMLPPDAIFFKLKSIVDEYVALEAS